MRPTQSVRSFACVLAAFASVLSSHPFVVAQTRFGVSASIIQFDRVGNDPKFTYSVTARPFISPGAVIESLLAPDGKSGSDFAIDGRQFLGQRVSLAQAQSAISGIWTLTERRGTELLSYEFELPELTPAIFPEIPEIISPTQRSEVGAEFLLDYKFPSGAEPTLGGREFSKFQGIEHIESNRIDNTAYQVALDFEPGVTESNLTMSVQLSQSVPLEIRPISPGADATFRLNIISTTSVSSPITVTARIPEPNTIALLALAVAIPMVVRREQLRN